MIAVYIILALLVIFIAVLLIRTAMFKPAKTDEKSFEDVEFDRDKAVDNLAALIKCKTVSYRDPALEDDAEFQKLIYLLPELYPNVFKTCTLKKLPDRALLFHWKGRTPGKPAVMMAHYDVVPVVEENWEKPPFEAIIEDGVMWGRGTLDTKITSSPPALSLKTTSTSHSRAEKR